MLAFPYSHTNIVAFANLKLNESGQQEFDTKENELEHFNKVRI